MLSRLRCSYHIDENCVISYKIWSQYFKYNSQVLIFDCQLLVRHNWELESTALCCFNCASRTFAGLQCRDAVRGLPDEGCTFVVGSRSLAGWGKLMVSSRAPCSVPLSCLMVGEHVLRKSRWRERRMLVIALVSISLMQRVDADIYSCAGTIYASLVMGDDTITRVWAKSSELLAFLSARQRCRVDFCFQAIQGSIEIVVLSLLAWKVWIPCPSTTVLFPFFRKYSSNEPVYKGRT